MASAKIAISFYTAFYVDYVFLLLYGVIGYQYSRAKFYAAAALVKRVLPLLLPIAAVFDFLENTTQIYLTHNAADAWSMLYLLAGCFSAVKWGCIALFVVVLGVAAKSPKP